MTQTKPQQRRNQTHRKPRLPLRDRARTRVLVRVMRLMGKRFWPYVAALVIFTTTIAICFNIILAFLMKDVIDAAAQNDSALIRRAILLAVTTFLGGTPVLVGMRYLAAVCIKRTMTDLRTRTFHHLASLPMGKLKSRHSGDLVSRVTNDLGRIEGIYFDLLSRLLIAVIMGVSGIGAIFVLNRWLGVIALVLGLMTTAAYAAFAKPMKQTSSRVQRHSATLTERLMDLLQGVSVTRMFNLDKIIHGRYATANEALAEAQISIGRITATSAGVNTALGWLRGIGFLSLGLILYSRGELALGSVWAVVSLRGNADFMFTGLGNFITGVQQSLVAASRVFEILDLPAEPDGVEVKSSGMPATADSAAGGASIEMHGICFRYPDEAGSNGDADPSASVDATSPGAGATLNGVSPTVARGQVAAFVGPSGAGKSTVMQLLLGFYAPDAGEITIAGRRLSKILLTELREMIAYVPQEAFLFDGTIEENIRLGRPEATTEEVTAAATAAMAHDFILAQPEGYATRIGERGTKLSRGQRQRIAIARALLKDAPILLLDEATSALDSESEALVQEALGRLMAGRTTLAVAHRLSTIEHADVIYVMEDGMVVEEGPHADLLARDGLYAQLHELQFT